MRITAVRPGSGVDSVYSLDAIKVFFSIILVCLDFCFLEDLVPQIPISKVAIHRLQKIALGGHTLGPPQDGGLTNSG